MRDAMSGIHPLLALAPVVVTDNTEQLSAAIDVKGYEGLTFLIVTGTLADADATFAVEVRECDTSGGTYTAVADADLVGTEALAGFTFSDDGETRKVGYKGTKRYVKCAITPSGNTGNAPLAVIALLSHAARRPTANPPV